MTAYRLVLATRRFAIKTQDLYRHCARTDYSSWFDVLNRPSTSTTPTLMTESAMAYPQ